MWCCLHWTFSNEVILIWQTILINTALELCQMISENNGEADCCSEDLPVFENSDGIEYQISNFPCLCTDGKLAYLINIFAL